MGQKKISNLHIVTDIKALRVSKDGKWKEQTDSGRRSFTSGFQSNSFKEISSFVLWQCFDGFFASFVVVLESPSHGSEVLCCFVYHWNLDCNLLGHLFL